MDTNISSVSHAAIKSSILSPNNTVKVDTDSYSFSYVHQLPIKKQIHNPHGILNKKSQSLQDSNESTYAVMMIKQLSGQL